MRQVAGVLAQAAMPLLRRLDPERAHNLALAGLRLGLGGRAAPDEAILAVSALGLRFANPIGLAAGFDKDARAIGGLAGLGFGFVETGTVTPRPQPGNPRPRLFRLDEDNGVINRMGFNNAGLDAYLARLSARAKRGIPIGANVGVNKEGADPERDYPALVAAVAPKSDYVVINISSPNTPGLRDLQQAAPLRAILRAIAEAVPRRPPLLLKLAPDLSEPALEAAVAAAVDGGAQGLIIGNTTIDRPPGLRSRHATEAGGLSGAPLFSRSTAMLARAHRLAAGRLVLVGTGGVATGAQALAKIRAGATLVQLYTAFAYAGPALLPRLKGELVSALRAGGFASVAAAVGTA